jgi:hypothetical protein
MSALGELALLGFGAAALSAGAGVAFRWCGDRVAARLCAGGAVVLGTCGVLVALMVGAAQPQAPGVAPAPTGSSLPPYDPLGCVQLVRAADTGAWVCVPAEQAG